MPAEWEPHQGTLLTWPHIPKGEKTHPHWPGLFEHIPAIWARMTKELEQGEEVHIVTHDEEVEASIKAEFKKAKVQGDRVHMHRIPSNFAWARDHGPIVVKRALASDDPERAAASRGIKEDRIFLDWMFNAHGNQWEYADDDKIPARLGKDMGIPTLPVPMVLEGGSIDVNGKGTLLTTEDCLLNPNRNPDMNKAEIEEHLKTHLGLTNVLWLGEGIKGDDTSGHVDDLTRFVGDRTVVTIVNNDESDPDHQPLKENLERLKTMNDQDGKPLDIITIDQPKPVYVDEHAPTKAKVTEKNGFRIPASYANFYIGNECVLLPVWNDKNDAKAVDVLQKCFPTRRIVPIDSRILTWGFGSFHCTTQQIPV